MITQNMKAHVLAVTIQAKAMMMQDNRDLRTRMNPPPPSEFLGSNMDEDPKKVY